jgi:cyanophycin synthetase
MNTSVRCIYDELVRRDIVVEDIQLSAGGTLLVFEYAGKLRCISGVAPDISSGTGRTIANNKRIAYKIAMRLGLVTPATEQYHDAAQARTFLKKYGRIVVKPFDGAHGDGVVTGVATERQLSQAIEVARDTSDTVLLQQQVQGTDVRVLVVDGQAIAISERQPASVVGDGNKTIEQLIAQENADNPLRGEHYKKPMNYIDMTKARRFVGSRMEDIPAAGEVVQVVGTANIGSGGVAVNRTGQLPAELVQSAVMIAKALNLFICGVDFMYDKARETWHFIEINSSPSFGLHLWPHEGEPVDVTGAYVNALLGAYSRDR